jgi:pimeloyl-ACP methyl ester carboxylesterase
MIPGCALKPLAATRVYPWFVFRVSTSATSATGGKETVILLHGLARTGRSMRAMADALTTAGYAVVNVDYPSRTAAIETLAATVIPDALQSSAAVSAKKIHFVTHSMGGILVRCYLKDRAIDRLGRVVMFGPPNQGSEVVDRLSAYKIFSWINGPAGAQLGTGPDSVPCRLGPVNFELGVIAGDRSINWINSLMISGPDDGKVSVERTKIEGMRDHLTIHATHPFLMKNRRVIAQTLAFLKNGRFDRTTRQRGHPAAPASGTAHDS